MLDDTDATVMHHIYKGLLGSTSRLAEAHTRSTISSDKIAGR